MHFKLLAFMFSIKLSANGKFRVAGMKCEELEAFLFIGKWAPVGNFRGLDFEVFSNLLCVVAPIRQPN